MARIYDPNYPSDKRSEESDAAMELRHDRLTNSLAKALVYRARPDGMVPISLDGMLEDLARSMFDDDTYKVFMFQESTTEDAEFIRFKFREDLERAVCRLVETEFAEWVIRNGWPWLRIPYAAHLLVDVGGETGKPLELRQRIEELREMPYPEYLLTKEWSARRELHLEHARSRCQVCNGLTSLQVHHRTYERRGNELFSDLVVLCGACHQAFHDNLRLAQGWK